MKHKDKEPEQIAESLPAETDARELDAHGFNPDDYQWVPVLRRRRSDGWTPDRQIEFIAALADCGCVAEAARQVQMSVTACYKLRRSPGGENFAAAWDAAMAQASRRLVDLAFDRAINGSDEPVFDKDGRRVGRRMKTNDRLLMFLLRAYMPDRFRHAHKAVRIPDEELPAPVELVGDAIRRLEPVTPPDPHLLMPPEDLETALECAHFIPGELPHWHRWKRQPEPEEAPLGEEFEKMLAAAKGEAYRSPEE